MTEVNNAVIAGNNLFSFSRVPRQHRTDIQDLFMYADYRANQIWRPHSQWTSWINYYRSQLINSGCELKSQIVKPAMAINSARELDNISFGVTGTVRVGGLMDLARRSFRAARLSEHARHFFEYGVDSGYSSSFQVVPCIGTGADDVSIMICGLHVTANVDSDSRGGDRQAHREMIVRIAGGVYNFNGSAFAPYRSRIQSRLLEVGRFNLELLSV